MKNLASVTTLAFAAILFTCSSCNSNTEPAQNTGNTVTEDMVDGADAGLDSLNLPPEEDTTLVED